MSSDIGIYLLTISIGQLILSNNMRDITVPTAIIKTNIDCP